MLTWNVLIGTLTNMEIENIKFERGFQPLITAARSDDPDIQKEAALLFRTLASGDHGASEIVRQGAIQHVVHLLTSVSTEAKIFATDVLILLAEKGFGFSLSAIFFVQYLRISLSHTLFIFCRSLSL